MFVIDEELIEPIQREFDKCLVGKGNNFYTHLFKVFEYADKPNFMALTEVFPVEAYVFSKNRDEGKLDNFNVKGT